MEGSFAVFYRVLKMFINVGLVVLFLKFCFKNLEILIKIVIYSVYFSMIYKLLNSLEIF